jgi:hypothetical protein
MAKQINCGPGDRKELTSAVDQPGNTAIIKLKPVRKIICLYIAILCVSCHKHHDAIPSPSAPQFNKAYTGYFSFSVTKSHDDGYAIAGFTNYDSATHGLLDAWVAKLDKEGTKLWQKTIGGSSYDAANFITTTLEGGFVMAGFSDGDAMVVKLDGEGNIIWQKLLGGYGGDVAHSVAATRDGGYVIACETGSFSGDVTGNLGGTDGWVVKLDKDGNILWQKALGGSDFDTFYSIAESPDGGYIAAGDTRSDDGDVSGYHGVNDGWVVKLDKDGNKLWQKTMGGSNADGIKSIIVTPDGGYLTAGITKSNDGDISGNHGEGDAWIARLDKDGNTLWQKALGGSDWETAYAVASTAEGSYVIAASTRSNDGDVSGFHGGDGDDAWVVKLDKDGNKLWQKVVGGSATDVASSIVTIVNGGYVIAGDTRSNDGDMSGSLGAVGAWVFTLKDP